MKIKPLCLVVDDEVNLCTAFRLFLENDGYHADTAITFNEALDKIKSNHYDLIVTDISLENESGIELMVAARKFGVKCPFIIATGFPDTDTAIKSVKLGAYDYLVKPIMRDDLLKSARHAISQWETEQARYEQSVQMDAIYRSIDSGLILLDGHMKIIKCNDLARKLCEYLPIGATTCPDKDPSCLINKAYTMAEESRKTKKTTRQSLHECHGNFFSITATPLFGIDSQWMGTMLSVSDKTRLLAMEKALEPRKGFGRLIGTSESMLSLYASLDLLASAPTTCLIYGESGTGKELVAEALHECGNRKDKPFVKINCAAVNDELLESELFGHVKGAFTGAISNKIGRFQQAAEGTIFLDEIGDISPRMQVRLLRVLQEKEIEPVGGNTVVKVDCRVITATNKNLQRKVEEGLFREDLYYRLSVFPVNIPPLRERKQDIPAIADNLIAGIAKEHNRGPLKADPQFIEALLAHHWPGNVRELKNVLEQAIIKSPGQILRVQTLPLDLITTQKQVSTKFSKENIISVLDSCDGNKAKAARILGIDRKTLYNKISELGI